MTSSGVDLQRTPLHAVHVALGARMVPFGGWDMPVQYTSILKEHAAVRTTAGLFDISHMGEVRVKGSGAVAWLNETLTNQVEKVSVGSSQYTLLLNDQGGVIDDLFLYRPGEDEFLLMINASMIEEDIRALKSHLNRSDVILTDESRQTAAMALQGPVSSIILDRWIPGASAKLPRFAIQSFETSFGKISVARTGYTGEDGFEIITSSSKAADIWNHLLKIGQSDGLIPCGLGARDTLRMEVCYPLNGHELGPEITPLEAGLGIFVDLNKPRFPGKDILVQQKANGVPRKAVALLAQVPGAPPRADYPVCKDGKIIGKLTSGCLSPTLQKGIGLALIETAHAMVGNTVDIEIRGKYNPSSIVKKPFYQKPK